MTYTYARTGRPIRIVRAWKYVVLVKFLDTGERCKVHPADVKPVTL